VLNEDSEFNSQKVVQQARETKQTFGNVVVDNIKQFPEKAVNTIKNVFGELNEKVMNKISPQETLIMSYQFINEISMIPALPSTKDMVIYKTILLKNNGNVEWPRNTIITPVDGVKGQSCRIGNIQAGKEATAILILDGPLASGKFSSTWRMSYINDKKENVYFGETFTLGFEIPADKKIEAPKKEEIVTQKPVEEKLVQKVETQKDFDDKVIIKAKQMKELFPEADTKALCYFINAAPDLSIEELIESYLSC